MILIVDGDEYLIAVGTRKKLNVNKLSSIFRRNIRKYIQRL